METVILQRIVNSLVEAEYDDGIHPVVAKAIESLRDVIRSLENQTK